MSALFHPVEAPGQQQHVLSSQGSETLDGPNTANSRVWKVDHAACSEANPPLTWPPVPIRSSDSAPTAGLGATGSASSSPDNRPTLQYYRASPALTPCGLLDEVRFGSRYDDDESVINWPDQQYPVQVQSMVRLMEKTDRFKTSRTIYLAAYRCPSPLVPAPPTERPNVARPQAHQFPPFLQPAPL